MSHKRLRCCPARNNLQHGRFYFNVVTGSEEITDTVNDFTAHHKGLAGLFTGDKVHITLAILGFLVG